MVTTVTTSTNSNIPKHCITSNVLYDETNAVLKDDSLDHVSDEYHRCEFIFLYKPIFFLFSFYSFSLYLFTLLYDRFARHTTIFNLRRELLYSTELDTAIKNCMYIFYTIISFKIHHLEFR